MYLKLNPKELQLKDLLIQIPPDFVVAEQVLQQEMYTVENISKIGTDYAWECVEECWDYFWDHDVIRNEEVIPNLHSTYICDVLTFLLQHGLDPNAIFEEENIMDNLRYLDNGYLAADALVLLFEHGGNPNLYCCGESVFNDLDFSVFFDAGEQQDRQRYSSLVHCWMVCLAFGATNPDGSLPVNVSRGFDIRKLKNHRNYYFGIIKGDPWPDIHIFDRKNLYEVVWA